MRDQLNPKQQKFCEYYVSNAETFANGVQAYGLAYGCDLNDRAQYNTAKTNANKLLRQPAITAQIDRLLEAQTLNPQYVAKQLGFLIQQNANLNVKRLAIADYFRLYGRPQRDNTYDASRLSRRAQELARKYNPEA